MYFCFIQVYIHITMHSFAVLSIVVFAIASQCRGAPVASKETPVAAKGAPVAPKETPVAAKETLVAATGAPVAAKGAPVAPTKAPVTDVALVAPKTGNETGKAFEVFEKRQEGGKSSRKYSNTRVCPNA